MSVNVPGRAGIAILVSDSSLFNDLLSQIPNIDISSLSEHQFEQHLGSDSRSAQLWGRLRRNGPDESKWGIGPTTASKIMARKRPGLIPIEDSVVDRVIERGTGNSWRLWWEAFNAEGDYFENRANELRDETGRPDLSTLRVFVVMLWMWGKANPQA